MREPRFRLRPSLEAFPASDGDLYLLQPGESGDLVIRDADDVDRRLVAALNTARSVADLSIALSAASELIEEKLSALDAAGALVEETAEPVDLPGPLLARFDRQLPYFAETGEPGAAQLALRSAKIVVLGCGGLGTWALGALACTGVGRFVLVDDDNVDLSNLNRQILYGADDLGAPKVERSAAWLGRFDPSTEVRVERRRIACVEDLLPLLEGADALVQAADWPPGEILRLVDLACRTANVPYVTAGQVPPVLKVGPTYIPGASACYACHEMSMRREFPLYEELAVHRANQAAAAMTLGPASAVLGAFMAMEVMHLLIGRRPLATEGRALLIDMRTLDSHWEAVERLADCPACGDGAGRAHRTPS